MCHCRISGVPLHILHAGQKNICWEKWWETKNMNDNKYSKLKCSDAEQLSADPLTPFTHQKVSFEHRNVSFELQRSSFERRFPWFFFFFFYFFSPKTKVQVYIWKVFRFSYHFFHCLHLCRHFLSLENKLLLQNVTCVLSCFCIILSVSSSAPCTSLEDFRASFWTTSWPTPLRPARPFLTQPCVPLLDQVSAVTGAKINVSPGRPNHLTRCCLLLFALHDPVRHPGLLLPGRVFVIHPCLWLSLSLSLSFMSTLCVNVHHNHTGLLAPKRPIFFMKCLIIRKYLASEVSLHNIIMGTEGQCCNNYLILK